jgi:putative polyhydroxyalkanoate system protein
LIAPAVHWLYSTPAHEETKPVPSISITRRHKLSHKKAKVAAEKIALDLEKRFDLAYEWDGDHIAFERPGLSGTLHVGRSEIRLDVDLSLLLLALKGPIEREIHKELDQLLGKA